MTEEKFEILIKEIKELTEEIRRLNDNISSSYCIKEENDEIRKVLKELGISFELKGYRYLYTAIDMVIKDPERKAITKVIYPEIAKKYNVSHASVEHSIRTAILKMLNKDSILKEKIFGPIVCPTNSEFIFYVAEYLKN